MFAYKPNAGSARTAGHARTDPVPSAVNLVIGGGWIDLFGAEEGVAEEEERAEDPDEGADFAVAAGAEFDEGKGEQAKTEAGRDAEGQWRGHECEECGGGLAEIVPTNARDGATHERANEDEGRSGSVRGNRSDERRAKHGDKEERGDGDVAEPCASTSRDSGSALDIAGDRGGTGERTEHGSESVREQRAAGARELPVSQEAAFFANANQRAYVVEEVDEEKHKDEFAEAKCRGRAQVQLEKRARWMGQREKMRGPVTESERNAGEGDDDDAEEDGAADAPGHQNGDENESAGGEKDLRIGNFAQSHECGGIRHDDIGVAQSNERDE